MPPEFRDKNYSIKHILVVDDEIDICNNLTAFFEDEGYRVSTAYNGAEGLERFKEDIPDLVIVDLHMPVTSGHALLKELTQDYPEIPKLVFSGVGVISEAMEAVSEGAWDFLPKPISDYDILTHKVKQLQEKASLLKQNRLYREHLEQLVDEKTLGIKCLNCQNLKVKKNK